LALVGSLLTIVIGAVGIVTQVGSGAATSGWYVATTPGTGADDILLGSSCANATQCWAVGVSIEDINTNSNYAPIVETWNGTAWMLAATPPVPTDHGGGFFDISCLSGSDCWAVGAALGVNGHGNPTGSLIENWNGSSWSIVPNPNPTGPGVAGAILQSVNCTSSSNCVAVGYSTDDNGENLNDVIEQWDGSTWNIVPGAATGQTYDQLSTVRCLAADDCWAVGNAGPAQQNPHFLPIYPGAIGDQGLIEHWDGTSWTITPSAAYPSPEGGYLYGLACADATDCWASGATTDSSGNASGIVMQHWDGSTWTDVSASVPDSSTPGILSSISCLGSVQCWAVGSLGSFGGGGGSGFRPTPIIENWNGSSWSIDPSPNVTALGLLDTLTCVQAVACLAAGTAATENQQNPNDPGLRPFVEQMAFPPASSQGIVLTAHDGGVFNYGTAQFHGSMGGQRLNAPVVGIAETIDGGGYWEVASDGGVFNFGDAVFYGSMGGQHLNAPVVGIAATPDGHGYWLVASDGGVFRFGDAQFHGSMGGQHLNAPVVGIAASGDDGGYFLVASDGGVFNFGDAGFFGSAGGLHLNAPVTGIAATPDGGGYWLGGSDGGVFNYGDAGFYGSVPGQGIVGQPPVVGISRTPTGAGYWLVGSNGAVYTYGDATFLGSPDGTRLNAAVSGIASP
jgi:hypothetical protein